MEEIFQHFRKDEQQFIEQANDWLRDVEDMYAPKLTDFLDPRQRFIIQSLIGSRDVQMAASGLFEQAERQRVLLHPAYYVPSEDDFQITMFELRYPIKFVSLKHPDILGALMSLGLERGKFGDIRIGEGRVQLAVMEEVAPYLRANFISAGKVKVQLEEVVDSSAYLPVIEEWIEEAHTVSSLRLDAVMSSVYKISRQKAAGLINGGKVKVNWSIQEQVSFELHESDLMSARGLGRVQIQAIEGRTKKDKIRLLVGKLELKK
ncbi:RNA-binding protein [Planococcus sp. ISL-109]|uniref:YlmH family RNA-binding protein n=1 Tax=Planococcus sp. ISL-109 TaxID=2819166 RepID=UPI001BE90A97|nr:RNA-binding protein [Planococcus sp. ISL-109]MBT2581866.1 RNA-binding protein [Planococcus sp. ISL-109]